MKTIPFIAIIIILGCLPGAAQKTLIPYLKNELYGFTNEDRKIIIEPQFSEVRLHNDFGMFSGKLAEGWIFYSLEGKELVRSTFQEYKINPGHVDYVNSKMIIKSNLVIITDARTKRSFVCNPFFPQHEVVYLEPDVLPVAEKSWMGNISTNDMGIFKICQKGKCNFIDTTGALLLSDWIGKGSLVHRSFLSVDNAGKFALSSLDIKPRTPFRYDRIVGSINPDYFHADRKDESDAWIFSLIDTDGRTTLESKKAIKPIDENHVLLNSPGKWGVYKYTGEPVFEMEGAEFEYQQPFFPHKIIFTKNGKKGLVDISGKKLPIPSFSHISDRRNGILMFRRGEGTGVMDVNAKELWFIDSLTVDFASEVDGYYVANKIQQGERKYGLIDSAGTILLPFIWDQLYFEIKRNVVFIVAKKNNQTAFYTLQGKEIIKPTDGRNWIEPIMLDIYFITENSGSVFSSSGRPKFSFNYDPTKSNFESITTNTVFLTDENFLRSDITNKQISAREDMYSGRMIALVSQKDSNWKLVFNESARKEISPDGYALSTGLSRASTGTNGGIIVLHKADVEAKKDHIKAGVIDFDGNWLIPPKEQVIEMMGSKVIKTFNTIKREIIYYNRLGKKLSSSDDELILPEEEWFLELDRIMIRDLKSGLYGFIDTEGNMIVKPQYHWVSVFEDPITAAGGMTSGKKFSSIIDLKGKQIITAPYDTLIIQAEDSSYISFLEDGKWGLMNLQGDVVAGALYDWIAVPSIPGMWVGSVGTKTIVSLQQRRTEIEGTGKYKVESINDDFIQLIINPGSATQKIYVFSVDGNYHGSITTQTTKGLSGLFNHTFLPLAYATVQPPQGLPYVVNLITQTEFRE